MDRNDLSDYLTLWRNISNNEFWSKIKNKTFNLFHTHLPVHHYILQIRAIVNNPTKSDEVKATEINAIKVIESDNEYIKNLSKLGKTKEGLITFIRIINDKKLNEALPETLSKHTLDVKK